MVKRPKMANFNGEQEGTEETEIEKCAVSRELRAIVARNFAAAVGRLRAPLRRAGTARRVVASRLTSDGCGLDGVLFVADG